MYVDGKLSDFEHVPVGVPQGSVLGALLYILFVNDLPEVVHGHSAELEVGNFVAMLMIVPTCTKVRI